MRKSLSLFLPFIAFTTAAQAAVVVTPALKSTNAATTTLKLSTTLITPLRKGDSVKMDYGKGLKTMTCADEVCVMSFNAATVSEAIDYKVGVYEAKKIVQGGVQTGTYDPAAMTTTYDTVEETPVSEVSIAAATVKFTATLTAPLLKNESVKIDYGKGLKVMTCSGKTCTLSSNTLPASTQANYKISLYKGTVVQNDAMTGTYKIASNPPPVAQASYTKLSNTGAPLDEAAKQGTTDTDWACTKDNKTGLVWEVKTTDKGLHDVGALYSWYAPASSSVNKGKPNGGYCHGSRCDTEAYKTAVNAGKLCGAQNWRLPTRNELIRLIYCSDDQYSALGDKSTGYICTNGTTVTSPTINATYFPNILQKYWVWTATQDTKSNSYALVVDFNVGYVDDFSKTSANHVFLVHQ